MGAEANRFQARQNDYALAMQDPAKAKPGPAKTAADPAPAQRFLARVAMDTLHRSLTDAESARQLELPRETIVHQLVRSSEAMTMWIEEELYYFFLIDNFRPAGEAIDELPYRLLAGKTTARDAITEIMLSTGFSLRNPGNDTFVTVVLEQGLGIEVQKRQHRKTLEQGKQLYDGTKGRFLDTSGDSQADVIRIVLAQPAFAQTLLNRHHQRLFGMPLAQDDPTIARVHQDHAQFFDVLEEWLRSPAYVAALSKRRAKTDRQFARGLYVDLLSRSPDRDELRNMRNALQAMADPAPIRTVLAKVMLDSSKARLPDAEEPGAFIAACFERFLKRPPTPQEADHFAQVATKRNAKRKEIARALVGSAEYAYY